MPDLTQRDAASSADPLIALRRRVLRGVLNVLAVGVPLVSALIVAQAVHGNRLDRITVVLSAYTLVFPALRLASGRLGFRASAIGLLGLLLLTSLLIASRGGVAAGNVSLNALVLLLGALFFGRRGALLGLLGIVGAFALAGWWIVSGRVAPVEAHMWDSSQAHFWLRETLASALMGLGILVTQVFVVEQLVTEARASRALAAREQAQRLALERAEREREHEREQRLQAQEALEESRRVEALGRLAGGIAHDFNNALTVILSAADEARTSRFSPDEVARCCDDASEAANSAAELTRQLLTLGRAHVSKPEPVRLEPLLARLHAALERVLPDDVTLVSETCEPDLSVHADPMQLERALFNLVLNARDAMPAGGRLEIVCEREPPVDGAKAGLVVLSVRDHGVGMDEATLERVFEPFFTTKGVGAGTGLGLATVHAFAREAGGDVQVSSTPGRGTTFHLMLPASEAPPAPEASAVRHGARESGRVPGSRILVVEDRDDVREAMLRMLEGGGFSVTGAEDGDAALRALEHETFALMCIDGIMPGTGTAEVIERAAALQPQVRVLLCSGYVPEDLLRRGIRAGRYPFLAKPFSARQLLDAVSDLLAEDRPQVAQSGHGRPVGQ